jgi:hypothetical protein
LACGSALVAVLPGFVSEVPRKGCPVKCMYMIADEVRRALRRLSLFVSDHMALQVATGFALLVKIKMTKALASFYPSILTWVANAAWLLTFLEEKLFALLGLLFVDLAMVLVVLSSVTVSSLSFVSAATILSASGFVAVILLNAQRLPPYGILIL